MLFLSKVGPKIASALEGIWGNLHLHLCQAVMLCYNHSQEHPSTVSLPASVSAVQTVGLSHQTAACPTHILAVHLSVALPTYLLGMCRENYFTSVGVASQAHFLVRMCNTALWAWGAALSAVHTHISAPLMAVPGQPLGQPAQHNPAKAPDSFPDNSQQETKISSWPCLRQQSSKPGAKLRHQEPVIETCLVKRGTHEILIFYNACTSRVIKSSSSWPALAPFNVCITVPEVWGRNREEQTGKSLLWKWQP